MKDNGLKFQTLSKYGRLNFDDVGGKKVSDVDTILSELKSIENGNYKRKSITNKNVIPQRLLTNEKAVRKPRKISRAKAKSVKNPPTIPQATFKDDSCNGVPASDQYDPDYDVLLPRAPQMAIPSLPRSVVVNPDKMTMLQMLQRWQQEIRVATTVTEKAARIYELEVPEKPNNVPGVIKRTVQTHEQPLVVTDSPGPAIYTLSRPFDKHRIPKFELQSSRPDPDPGPDRSHFGVGASIDATKPKPIQHILPPKLGHSDKEEKQISVWEQIEKEQAELMEVLKPKAYKPSERKEPPPPKAIKPLPGPFDHMIKTEAPDVEYDVDGSLRKLEKKIPPREHFGRRIDDSDRTIYVKSEAPDVIYPNTNDAWLKTKPSSGVAPSMIQMHDRKSAYDYMPSTCGGSYTNASVPWDKGTGIRFNLMAYRTYMDSLPPQFTQPRASSSLINHFPGQN